MATPSRAGVPAPLTSSETGLPGSLTVINDLPAVDPFAPPAGVFALPSLALPPFDLPPPPEAEPSDGTAAVSFSSADPPALSPAVPFGVKDVMDVSATSDMLGEGQTTVVRSTGSSAAAAGAAGAPLWSGAASVANPVTATRATTAAMSERVVRFTGCCSRRDAARSAVPSV